MKKREKVSMSGVIKGVDVRNETAFCWNRFRVCSFVCLFLSIDLRFLPLGRFTKSQTTERL